MQEARRVGDVNEAALLEVARVLVEQGVFQTTPIGQIAERANISRQGFYFYFNSKDELLAQLVTDTLLSSQGWRATMYLEGSDDPAAGAREMIMVNIGAYRQNRELFRAAIEMGPRAPAVMEHWIALVEETAEFLADQIVEATTIEALRDRDAARSAIVTLIWMIERNTYMHVVRGQGDESDEVFADRLSDLYVRALGIG
jgi:AcrR family transcriptional regulator